MKGGLKRYLDIEDGVLVGYLLALAVAAVAFDTDSERPERGWSDQSVTLTEDHLRRLEHGDRVQVDRWHGYSVELEGALVVDARRADQTDDPEPEE